jgi:hypothetical protein
MKHQSKILIKILVLLFGGLALFASGGYIFYWMLYNLLYLGVSINQFHDFLSYTFVSFVFLSLGFWMFTRKIEGLVAKPTVLKKFVGVLIFVFSFSLGAFFLFSPLYSIIFGPEVPPPSGIDKLPWAAWVPQFVFDGFVLIGAAVAAFVNTNNLQTKGKATYQEAPILNS